MKKYAAVTSGTALTTVIELHEKRQQNMFPVVDDEKRRMYLGYITYDDVSEYIKKGDTLITSGKILAQIIPADATRLVHAHLDDPLEKSLKKITTCRLQFLPVVDDAGVYEGVVDAESIAQTILNTKSRV